MSKAISRELEKKRRKKKNPLEVSPEELSLWRQVTSNVDPMKKKSTRLKITDHKGNMDQEPQPAGGKKAKPSAYPQVKPVNLTPKPKPKPKEPELSHGVAPGLDKRTAQKLRRGKVPIEGRLDLHGMTQNEAHRALDRFLDGAVNKGKRCVTIITGKGFQGEGVLRTQVPRWLNHTPNREKIISFTYGTPSQGGTGALVVMLRKKK
ncbi:MAG: Smr/MutS family protein [Rhodospirillales bacterium]|nr:Smr/MutS family protein [Rhodospirillales bacterium]